MPRPGGRLRQVVAAGLVRAVLQGREAPEGSGLSSMVKKAKLWKTARGARPLSYLFGTLGNLFLT